MSATSARLRPRRHARIERRAHDDEAGLGVDLGRVQLGHVERERRRQPDRAARAATRPRARSAAASRTSAGSASSRLADEEGVDERRQRLRVRRGRAAGDDQRRRRRRGPRCAAGCPRRSSTLSTFVYVSSYCSEKPTHVELGQRRRRLERQDRQPARAQLGLAVEPGRERPLAGDVGRAVEHAVEDLRPQVGHPDLVDVGERQADRAPPRSPDPCGPPDTRRRRSATASRPWSENQRTGAAWADLHARPGLLIALEDERELGPVLFGRLREHPARDDLLDAGLERIRNCGGPSRPSASPVRRSRSSASRDSLPCVRLLSRASARW